MNWSAPSLCWVVFLVGALSLAPGVSNSEGVEQGYKELLAAEDGAVGRLTTQKRSEVVANAFDRHLGGYSPEELSSLSDSDIGLYFRAAELVLSNSLRKKDLERMEVAFSEIFRRGIGSERVVRGMRSAYLSMRKFDQARELTRRHRLGLGLGEEDPSYLDNVPAQFQGPTMLEISLAAPQLTRTAFVPPTGGHIVVVAHPLCHFSQRAMVAINGDATLRALFEERASLLAPVDASLNLDVLRTWNSTFPAFRVALAYARDEWPDIDYWGTPTFYFFGDGGAVEKIVGWPPEGRLEEIRAAARTVGILADEQAASFKE